MKFRENPFAFILDKMNDIENNGDSYTDDDKLYALCKLQNEHLTYKNFLKGKHELIRMGYLAVEGKRLYLKRTLEYENTCAKQLAEILADNDTGAPKLPNELYAGEILLDDTQREAVQMALSHKVSIIMGGAGSGKTTIIRSIMDIYLTGEHRAFLLAAPTGMAAHNLHESTGYYARTVHSALGLAPDEDFLSRVKWNMLDLIIVDEASMLSLELLAGLLSRMPSDCRLILVGDPYQLEAVSAGNVLRDLLALGTPNILLRTQYRQDAEAKALSYNVHQFAAIQCFEDLQFDDSFILKETPEDQEVDTICELAEIGMLSCQDVRILAPTKDLVASINKEMQQTMNPPDSNKQEFGSLREGDTVMILKNNAKHHCYNGDIGALHFDEDVWGKHYAEVQLPDGRYPCFAYSETRDYLTLAYACTVHKAQGGQAETVIIYMGEKGKRLRKRNLLYTAISRATTQVIIVGNRAAVDDALKNQPESRKSMLVAKTNQVRRGWNRTA